jgi:hypothetical protein
MMGVGGDHKFDAKELDEMKRECGSLACATTATTRRHNRDLS